MQSGVDAQTSLQTLHDVRSFFSGLDDPLKILGLYVCCGLSARLSVCEFVPGPLYTRDIVNMSHHSRPCLSEAYLEIHSQADIHCPPPTRLIMVADKFLSGR